MKIKHEKGKVTYVMRTGKTFVRNHMPLAYAQSIINRSKDVEIIDKRGCGMEICVNDKYFFPADIEEPKQPKEETSNEVTE